MSTQLFILTGLLVIVYVIILSAVICSYSKSKKEIQKQKRVIDSQIESCRKVIIHEVEFIKHIYDIVVLSRNNPEFLHNKIIKMFFVDKTFETNLICDSIDMADICSNNLISHFAKIHPELSKSDLEFCSLICLGFPSHTMQKFYSMGNSTSYYNRRKRLRSKLKIESSNNLETFIKETIKSLDKKSGATDKQSLHLFQD